MVQTFSISTADLSPHSSVRTSHHAFLTTTFLPWSIRMMGRKGRTLYFLHVFFVVILPMYIYRAILIVLHMCIVKKNSLYNFGLASDPYLLLGPFKLEHLNHNPPVGIFRGKPCNFSLSIRIFEPSRLWGIYTDTLFLHTFTSVSLVTSAAWPTYRNIARC